jgi:hypothetical protein
MRTMKLVAVAVVVAALCTLVEASPSGAATTSARHLLSVLAVGGEGGSSTYTRTAFRHWIDADGDCQSTRAEVLIVESRVPVTFTSSNHCTVARGRWLSPWDYATWTNASDVEIDHLVALKEAWESGARIWGPVNRQRFANDLYAYTLDAITDNLNASKGDRDPAEWLPAGPTARCIYAIHWVQVKYRWRLSVDGTERAVLASLFAGSCGDKQVTIPARAI